MMKVMIAVNSKEEGGRLSDFLSRKGDVEIVGIEHSGQRAYDKIVALQPDVVLMNMILPELDGLGVMELLMSNLNIPHLPRVIILSAVDNPVLMDCACQTGVDYYIMKPYRLETIYSRIQQLYAASSGYVGSGGMVFRRYDSQYGGEHRTEAAEGCLEAEITDVLRRIGVPAHIKGYQYIRTGIMMAVQDIEVLNYITKLLYPTIAKQYHTTSGSVERAIRHAIEIAWGRGNVEALQEVFGSTTGGSRRKPTNSEFIAQIADRYRVDYNFRLQA